MSLVFQLEGTNVSPSTLYKASLPSAISATSSAIKPYIKSLSRHAFPPSVSPSAGAAIKVTGFNASTTEPTSEIDWIFSFNALLEEVINKVP